MLNMYSTNGSGNGPDLGQKKIFAIIAVGVLVVIVMAVFLVKVRKNNVADNKSEPIDQTEESKKINARVEEDLSKSTEFIGKVVGIKDPGDGNVVFLEIEANIIDKDAVSEADFSAESTELKSIKKIFSVAVVKETKLNVSDMSKIEAGDMVIVKSPIGIYEKMGEKFTALEVEVQSAVAQNNPEVK